MLKFALIFFGTLLYSSLSAQDSPPPVHVIFDTDMGPDYDDVGAIALLHAYADRGDAEILATVASTKYEGIAAVINVLNTYFKRPNIPIAVPKGEAVTTKDFQHWTDSLIANYPHAINKNEEVPDAVSLYRKILADQPDQRVTIVTVGFLTNIAALLQSSPDEHSPLSGKELVEKKVLKLVSMAGKFPSGREFNVHEDVKAAQYVVENWPRPILFSGFEIGEKIKTGLPLIQNSGIQNSPVKDAYAISIPLSEGDKEGRMSWDQTAVLVAVKGHAPYYKLVSGTMSVNDDGSNGWDSAGSKHFYLVEDRPFSEVQQIIDELMMHQPR
jgi:pyrimidine-specific ribonucleoside hydrolase